GLSGAREGGDDPGFDRDLPHRVVDHVDDVEITGVVEAEFVRFAESRLESGTSVAGVAHLPRARDGGEDAVLPDPADALTGVFAKVERAVGPPHDAEGIVELGGGGGASVS